MGNETKRAIDYAGFNLQRRLALVETSPNSSNQATVPCFNLQRRLALVETGIPQVDGYVSYRFNLQRRLALVETGYLKSMDTLVIVSISKGD